MWTLEECEKQPGEIHYLPCGMLLMVSRKEGHILLQQDNSISRQHASISITHSTSNLKDTKALPEVRLRDLGAKYGTYVNDAIEQDLKIADERILADGDRVRFGMLTNTWRLRYRSLVVTTSAIRPESKGEVQTALLKLGGHLVAEWNVSCMYLIMNTITLTIKVVCALAAGRHIVTPEFLTKWSEAVVNKTTHPEASKFLPPLQEVSVNQSLVDFSPNEQRKEVLSGQNFIISSPKQLKRMGPAITLAGGNAMLLSEENAKLVESTDYLLVQFPPEKNQDSQRNTLFLSAKKTLKAKGLRVIPESDIGLAILYMSTESHCNPTFKVSTILQRNGSASSLSSEGIKIYATETQDMEDSVSLTGTRVVPESALTTSSKRTISTVPGTSFSFSNFVTPATLSHASSTNTNVSMLNPVDSSLPRKSDLEDKENLLKNSRKRSRTASENSANPQAKRSSKPLPMETLSSEPEPTQPLEIQDDDDEEEEELVSKFEPKHFSTQNSIVNNCSKKAGDNSVRNQSPKPVNSKTLRAKGDGGNAQDAHDVVRSLEATTGRSLAFEPYTLPSLNVEHIDEDSDSAQPYVDTNIKEEPDSLPVDEPDCHSGKRRREEENLNVQDEDNQWFGAKKNKTDINQTHIKSERRSFNENGTVNPMTVKQEQKNNEEDFFALSTSARSRRRTEVKRKATVEDANQDDPFNIPSSSRSERLRKALKTEDGNSRMLNNKETEKETIRVQNDQQVASTSNASKCTENANWISKRSESDVSAPAQIPMKSEQKYGDVGELIGSFEKSLVVVEVVCLMRRRTKKPITSNESRNTSMGNLKNFKKFRKNGTDIFSLPKIIGGKDLVAHDIVVSRRDSWLQDNPDVTLLYEEREAQEHSNDNALDALFDLQLNPRNRGRVRR